MFTSLSITISGLKAQVGGLSSATPNDHEFTCIYLGPLCLANRIDFQV